MTVEVLVMCGSCGRGQPPRATCVVCGAVLPRPPLPDHAPPPSAAPAAAAQTPRRDRVEVELGKGRRAVIDPDALEVSTGKSADRFLFSSVSRVRLEERRFWPLVPAALALSFLVGFVRPWPLRILLLGALAASVWAFARFRRFAVTIERSDGASARVDLGAAMPGVRDPAASRRALVELGDELRRRGVEVLR